VDSREASKEQAESQFKMTPSSVRFDCLAALAKELAIPIGRPEEELTLDVIKAGLLAHEQFNCHSYERMQRPCVIAMYDSKEMRNFHSCLRAFFPETDGSVPKEDLPEGDGKENAPKKRFENGQISIHEVSANTTVRLLESTNRASIHGIDLHRLPWKGKDGGFDEWVSKYEITILGEGRNRELAHKILQTAFLFATLPKKDRPLYAPPVDHNQKTGRRFLLFLGGDPSGSPTELTFVAYSGGPAPKFLHQAPIDEAFRRPAIHRKETLLASGPQDKYRFYLSRDAGERDGSKIPTTLSAEMQGLLNAAEDAGKELAALSLATG